MTVFDRLHQGEHIDIRMPTTSVRSTAKSIVATTSAGSYGKLIRLLSNGWWSLKTSSLTARSRMALT